MASRLREPRQQRGWSQEELAHRLGVDRRQVVRLETGHAPVTLEVVEELARVFGQMSMTFMWSVIGDESGDAHVDSGFVRRLAQEEFRRLFGEAVRRPGVASVVYTAMELPDLDLELLCQVADAILKARAVTAFTVRDYLTLKVLVGEPPT